MRLFQFTHIGIALIAAYTPYNLYASEGGQCDSVLIQQTTATKISNLSQLSWLNIVTKSNYKEAQRSAEGQAYFDLFGGSYDEFIKKRSASFKKETYNSSLSQSRNEFKSFLSTSQVNAWRDCMVEKKATLFSYFKNIDKQAAALVVEWNVSPAIGKLKSIVTELDGATSRRLDELSQLSGQNRYILKRSPSGSAIRGIIAGVAGVNDQDYSTDFYLPKYNPVKPKPVTPILSARIFTSQGSSAAHPYARVSVPNGYKVIGGGAIVNWNGAGNLLTASYPIDASTWEAKAKDHSVSSPATIKVYAIAIHDPSNEWQVRIFSSTSSPSPHPRSQVNVPDNYLLTGGGAKVNWSGAGNLLTASYPSSKHAWEVRSKDHSVSSPASITAYAIGIRPRNNSALPVSHIFSGTGSVSAHPSYQTAVDSGYTLTGGGALDNWNGAGNLLTANYPLTANVWKAMGKDHSVSSPAALTVYAIGVKN